MAGHGLKRMAATKDLKLGHFIVEFATPGIGQILKAAGCDFVLFDTEHSGFGYETMKSALRYMQAAELPTIVRVPSKEYHHIARAADMGAEGIMLPMVGTADEARHILDCMKYTPAGHRGVALQVAHDRYRPGPVLDKLAAANEFTTLFAQIETREGVDNADAIAAVDGVDCLWIGHFDLSASLGIPGRFDHPEFLAAIATVAKACKKRKKALGRLVPTADDGVALYKGGFDFICYSGDVWVLLGALSEALADIRRRVDPAKKKGPKAKAAGKGRKK
ncbi:MAG: aldolase/citrate lyase family protein [Alphaproteobacteria bacterium]